MIKKDFNELNTTLIHQLKRKIEELNEEKEKLKNIFDSVNEDENHISQAQIRAHAEHINRRLFQ